MDNSSLEPTRPPGNDISPIPERTLRARQPGYSSDPSLDGVSETERAVPDFKRLWRRHWRLPVVLGLGLAVVTYIVSLFIPTQYNADAEVLIQTPAQLQDITGQSDSQMSSLESALSGPNNYFATELEMLTSDDTMNEVGRRLGIDLPVWALRERYKVVPHQVAENVVLITARGNSAKQAVDMVNTLIDVDGEQLKESAFSVNDHSMVVLGRLLRHQAQMVANADSAVTNFKRRVGTVDVGTDTLQTATELGTLKADLIKTQSDESVANASEQFYLGQYATAPKQVIQGLSFTSNPRIDADISKLNDLESQRAVLAKEYTPLDPQMQQIGLQMDAVKQDIIRTRDQQNHVLNPGLGTTSATPVHPPQGDWIITGGSQAPNPAREAARGLIVQAMASAEAARAEESAVKRSLGELHQTVSTLPTVQQKMLGLADNAATERGMYDELRRQFATLATEMKLQQPYIVVLRGPVPPKYPAWPFPFLYACAALLLGLIIGIIAMYSRDLGDPRIYDSEDGAKTAVPILGLTAQTAIRLPDFKNSPIRVHSSESHQALASTLMYMGLGRSVRTLMITSPKLGDGVTYTASSLAMAFSKVGINVILVDANIRNPALHALFGAKNNQGLAGLMRNGLNTDAALVPVEEFSALQLITGGSSEDGVSSLPNFLDGGKLALLMKSLKERAAIVIVDAPPVESAMETAALADKVDGVLLVYRSGATQSAEAQRVVQLLDSSGARVLGCVVNDPGAKTRN